AQAPAELAHNAGRVHDRPRVPAQRDRRRGGLASPSHAMAIASRSYAALAVYWPLSWPQGPFALGDFPVEQGRVGHAKHRESFRKRLSLIPANVGRSVSLSRWIPSSSLRDHHPDGSIVFFETALEGGGLSLRVFRSLRVLGEVEFSSREFAC